MASPTSGIYLVPLDLTPLADAVAELTYPGAARQIGCGFGYLHELLHGKRNRLTVEMAAKIEDKLGRPRGSMFTLSARDSERLAPYSAELCRLAS